ncbi:MULTISPECIES: PTS sugar transporter subunit IIA [Clostridia]|jgi:PTS system fructose-specific IIA component|uniref:PTS fructose transporter subunit IIA n=1 Tax=Lacrimispora celerecrescens TaxID=29354 RepID=A0A084JPQ6_9FIRM|nr:MULTISPECIES: PTS sugar transporter subunit IIA [Clostridia]MBW4844835.1 fructose PTS transporter subunit IIA [Lachnospiraceae bacterium]CUX64317.1 Heat-responsive suppressor HrsA [Clostridium sp. C105KSO15]HBC98416.1 PTS fructose transporter subunit IIA [Lachnoclostridium sp.]KEZ90940.1 PTS fructose transporter subunit IIA [Lacrimispora celerecrescens]MSS08390.1 PTS sugar transporter subunit IIA [Clostridium sp. WB02_MRS01]
MAVKEILDKRVIDLKMKAVNKDEVIRHLAGLLKKAGYVEDLEGYIKDVYLREEEGITGIGGHVAIPHGKSEFVDKVGIAVGRTEQMVEWESYDEEPVDLFFLFAVPSDSEGAKGHLRLIAELAGKLGNEAIMGKLQAASTYEDLLDAFS